VIGAKVCRNCGNPRGVHTLVGTVLECPAENYPLCKITGVHTSAPLDRQCIYCQCNLVAVDGKWVAIPR